ncbi:macro domain-containing protein [Ignisphaera sp. 4213-co]|uniref:Macro domain-containing protein n=1 Tax=Ignisphaera cupida TaxID=3050454 RepID=A0ABD4Z7P9_9CREN|nr:macro domain-containing protein [Ignisphaera sp. 4213-co]MDK6028729.1 macro domain-containing protein [Ignisphaera sp. 4213-co]
MKELCSSIFYGVVLRVLIEDVTKLVVDAIVNPANSLMVMGGGVAGAIKRVGGEEIEKEAMRYAPVSIGKAVATTAGRLPAKYVIHSPTMEKPAMRTTVDKVSKAVLAALEKALELGVKSIAFPGMGTGVGGLSYSQAAEAMVNTIKQFLSSRRVPLTTIYLVAIDEELAKEFCKAIEKH